MKRNSLCTCEYNCLWLSDGDYFLPAHLSIYLYDTIIPLYLLKYCSPTCGTCVPADTPVSECCAYLPTYLPAQLTLTLSIVDIYLPSYLSTCTTPPQVLYLQVRLPLTLSIVDMYLPAHLSTCMTPQVLYLQVRLPLCPLHGQLVVEHSVVDAGGPARDATLLHLLRQQLTQLVAHDAQRGVLPQLLQELRRPQVQAACACQPAQYHRR